MFEKLFCALIVANSVFAADEFLSRLYSKTGNNRMHICLKSTEGRRERTCPGALLDYEYVGVSAGCLRQHPQEYMLALRLTKNGESCDEIMHGYSSSRTRGVLTHYYHPWTDLALVVLDRPYVPLDKRPNRTAWFVKQAFDQHGEWMWMENYMQEHTVYRYQYHYYYILSKEMASAQAPLFMFFVAIFLPTLIFILVFIYVIYYSNSTEIPFKKLKYIKNEIKV